MANNWIRQKRHNRSDHIESPNFLLFYLEKKLIAAM